MKRIFLIAGHSNSDPGAVGNGYKEADLTKELRDLIWLELSKLNMRTVATDEDSKNLSSVIADISKSVSKDCIVLDIHFNASSNDKATGAEVIVEDKATLSKLEMTLAIDLAGITSSVLGIKNRGVKYETQTARGRLGIMRLRANVVLLEVAFISNESDMNAYQKNKYELAKRIARSLVDNYNRKIA